VNIDLTPNEKRVLELRAEPLTWREIGKQLQLSAERVRQIHARATRRRKQAEQHGGVLRGQRMSNRAFNVLEAFGLLDEAPSAIAKLSDRDILWFKGCGRKTWRELRQLQNAGA